MRRSLGIAVLLVVLLAPSRAAAASRVLGQYPGTLLSDDRYLVVADPAGQTLRVLDVATGRQRSMAVPDGCRIPTLEAGRLLFDCPTERDPVTYANGIVVDLRTRTTSTLPPLNRTAFGTGSIDQVRYLHAGSRWAAVEVSGYHYAITRYLRLADGEVRDQLGKDRGFVAISTPRAPQADSARR